MASAGQVREGGAASAACGTLWCRQYCLRDTLVPPVLPAGHLQHIVSYNSLYYIIRHHLLIFVSHNRIFIKVMEDSSSAAYIHLVRFNLLDF